MSKKSLKETLSKWSGLPKPPHRLEPRQTRKAAAEVARMWGTELSRKPADYDLKDLHQRISRSWQRYRILAESDKTGIDQLTWVSFFKQEAMKSGGSPSRDLRRLPWILFYPPLEQAPARQQSGSNGWLGGDPLFVRHYEHWLSEQRNTRSTRALLSEFLLTYPTKLSTFEQLRRLLQSSITGTAASNLRSMQKWQQRCHQFRLLEVNGSRLFIEKLVLLQDDVQEILNHEGFEGRLARGRFLKSGILEYLPRAGELLKGDRLPPARLARLLKVLEVDDGLRFDDRTVRAAIAESFLAPFSEGYLPHGARDQLEPFFMRHFGDPRLPSGKSSWSGVPEEFRLVIKRWLTEQTLEEFFRLIKETALDRHWSYRQTFWKAYFDHHLILDAWFVLGTRARRLMKSLKDKEHSYGMLRGGAAGDQSVLLLRMHSATIVEWSHSGACRIWLDGNSSAPELYRDMNSPYTGQELRAIADLEQPHYSSETGRWQDAIADWLQDNTGVEVPRSEYFEGSESFNNNPSRTQPGIGNSPAPVQPEKARKPFSISSFRHRWGSQNR